MGLGYSDDVKVFISYAKKDGLELALRLESDLREVGLDPWLDIPCIDGGASWSSTVETAIDGCAALLAIVTAASFRSPMCRAEQLRALRKKKRAIPLVGQPNVDRPLYLEHLQYLDFTQDYTKAFAELLRTLSAATSPLLPGPYSRTFVNLPPRPPHIVERPAEVKRVRDILLAEEGQTVGITALRGLGGIGKTVLANLVARDVVLQDAFPDGILWFDIGKTPTSLASQLTEIGRELEGSEFRVDHYSTLEAATNRLRRILPTKAALVILDDVWDPAHIQPFLFEAPRCRALVTAREGRIVTALGASEVRLDTLTPEQSQEMLRGWAGRSEPAFGRIADTVGHLPLALRIAGARLREGLTTEQWLADYGKRVSRLRLTRRSRSRDESVEACFLTSFDEFVEGERVLFDALGIFPEGQHIPLAQVTRLWLSLSPSLTEFDVRDLAYEFDRAALLQVTHQQTVVLHGLVQEFARERLGANVAPLNDAFLAAHNPDGKQWHEIPDDGYLHGRLAWHLTEAGRARELVRLLGSGRWLMRRLERYPASEVLSDFEYLNSDHELRLVQSALRLSAHVLSVRPKEFASQMAGRLRGTESGLAAALTRDVLEMEQGWRLQPLRTSLAAPGGPLLRTLVGHSDVVRSVAITSDGRLAISGSDDRTVRVWDLVTGAVRECAGHEGWVSAVAVAPDGRYAASASDDQTIRVWDLNSACECGLLVGHRALVTAVAIRPDGSQLISASVDQTLRVWDVKSGSVVRTLVGHTGSVTALGLSPDGTRAVSASSDETLRLWGLSDGSHRIVARHAHAVTALAWTGDGMHVLCSTSQSALQLWSIVSGVCVAELVGHEDGVTALALTADRSVVVSASIDETLRVWDLGARRAVRQLVGHGGSVTTVAVSSDSRVAISGSSDNTLKLWNLESDLSVSSEAAHSGVVAAVTLASDGRCAVSASVGQLKAWDLGTGAELQEVSAQLGWVRADVASPDGVRIRVSIDDSVWFEDEETGAALDVAVATAIPDGKRVVSLSDNGILTLWSLETGTELREMCGGNRWGTALAVTPDATRAVSASDSGALVVWDLRGGAEPCEFRGSPGEVTALAITPQGNLAILARSDGSVTVWDLFAGAVAYPLKGHTRRVNAIAVFPDGRHAVTASEDQTLRVWDLASGCFVCSFTADAPVTCALAAHGRVVAGDSSGSIHVLAFEEE